MIGAGVPHTSLFKSMRIMMLQVSGFCFRVPETLEQQESMPRTQSLLVVSVGVQGFSLMVQGPRLRVYRAINIYNKQVCIGTSVDNRVCVYVYVYIYILYNI